MALVYSPYAFGEIRVVGGDQLATGPADRSIPPRTAAASAARQRAHRNRSRSRRGRRPSRGRFRRKRRLSLCHEKSALPVSSAVGSPRAETNSTLGTSVRLRVLLAKKNGVLRSLNTYRPSRRSREALAIGAHQVDRRPAVDLRAAEEEGMSMRPCPARSKSSREPSVNGLAARRCCSETRKPGSAFLLKKHAGRRDRRRRADRRMARAVQQPRDHAGEVLFLGVRTHSSR